MIKIDFNKFLIVYTGIGDLREALNKLECITGYDLLGLINTEVDVTCKPYEYTSGLYIYEFSRNGQHFEIINDEDLRQLMKI